MTYQDFLDGLARFGTKGDGVCLYSLGLPPEKIRENVVLSPGWELDKVPSIGRAEQIVEASPLFGIKVWDIEYNGIYMTYIKPGCGAPLVMDALLPLGITGCKRILFLSSVGALTEDMGIGDIVLPEYSVCGDGASRYISSGGFDADVFGEKLFPNPGLFKLLQSETEKASEKFKVKWHLGRAFCTDTIFAQYPHIDRILSMGCNSLDMESAAAFRAAKLMGIPIAALLNVSDNTVANKSVVSKRTREEMDYRRFVRGTVITEIIHRVFETANQN